MWHMANPTDLGWVMKEFLEGGSVKLKKELVTKQQI